MFLLDLFVLESVLKQFVIKRYNVCLVLFDVLWLVSDFAVVVYFEYQFVFLGLFGFWVLDFVFFQCRNVCSVVFNILDDSQID